MALLRRHRPTPRTSDAPLPAVPVAEGIEIPEHDPFHAYLLQAGAPVDLERLELASPTIAAMRSAGVVLVVPLISQGELLGTLNLGPRLSDQPYSSEDRRLLSSLASQVAPAVKVANLVKEQEAETKERERIEQELKVAALIQQTLLPKELPSPPGWQIDAYYRPARAVGGDFYDFIPLRDGRLAFVIGDVTDKGVPAALVMATTRSHLRAAAQRHTSPGAVLADVNGMLVDEIPPGMFVTCLFGILDTHSGSVLIANAGHNLPYVRGATGVTEVRATGMPLGLMPGMNYQELSADLTPGEVMLLSSDGIVEAHDASGEMFGFGRVREMVGASADGDVIGELLERFGRFTGPGHEPEDDVTLVSIRRAAGAAESAEVFANLAITVHDDFAIASNPGSEREVMERVAQVVARLGIEGIRLERLKTAVAEAAMNAIEHGNKGNPDIPVEVQVTSTARSVVVRIADRGGLDTIPEAEAPDIEAKLAGQQKARGWGLFLIEKMVDEMRTENDGVRHIVELVMNRGEER